MILALTGVPLVIVAIIAFVLIIGVIICIHEAGHLFFAKRAGILCHEFSIGMGPVIYKKQFGETTFCIRAIPIGGFVSMAGEEIDSELIKTGNKIGINLEGDHVSEIILDDNKECQIRGEVSDFDLYGIENDTLFITINDGFQNHYYPVKRDAFYVFEKDKRMQITPYDRSMESKTLWQRFITLFAGPLMNLILAFVIYIIVGFATGVANTDSSVIGELSYGYPAYDVLKENDQIISVNDKKVDSWDEFSQSLDDLYKNYETKFDLTVIRNGEEITFPLEATTYITSIGLSNIQAPQEKIAGVNGLRVGNLAIRYKDDKKTGSYPLAYGDVITKMRIDTIDKKVVTKGEVIDLSNASWGLLIKEFEKTNLCNVYFEYYSQKKAQTNPDNPYVTIEDCEHENTIIESYTNEVLENQRIEKIQLMVGLSPTMKFSFFGSFATAGKMFWNDFTLIFRTLKLLIAPSDVRQVGVSDLSSFVGIFDMVKTYIGAGFIPLLAFAALLSVNIGVMNLLPIPALDGGRIVFLGYELITKKKPSKKVENIINNVFFILLMILFVYVTFNDVIRLFK